MGKSSSLQARVDAVTRALSRAGVEEGDTLFVHSALRSLGKVQREEVSALCGTLLKGLLDLLGPQGTLLVPAYFYEYARHNIPFDVARSPVSKGMGSFSAFVTADHRSVRSKNPTTSMAGIGARATSICGQGAPVGYGYDSPWDRMTKAGAKIAGIGTHFNTMTYVHYIEQVFGVPHMYHKYFQTPVYEDGNQLDIHVINYVRYLKYGIKAEMLKFEAHMRQKGLVRFEETEEGHVYAASCDDLFREGIERLRENPFYFLERTPEFIPGEIPLI